MGEIARPGDSGIKGEENGPVGACSDIAGAEGIGGSWWHGPNGALTVGHDVDGVEVVRRGDGVAVRGVELKEIIAGGVSFVSMSREA